MSLAMLDFWKLAGKPIQLSSFTNLHFQLTPQDKASPKITKISASAKVQSRDPDWGIPQLGLAYNTDSNAIYIGPWKKLQSVLKYKLN